MEHASVDKFQIQDSRYEFPYHYTPHFDSNGVGIRTRSLSWGWEYLTYLKHIQELIISLQPTSVLDVGCGDGRLIGLLKESVEHVVGVDLSERAIQYARAFHPEVDFRVINANQLDEEFDVVVAMEVLEHIPTEQVTNFLQSLEARAKNEGDVIISVPTTVIALTPKHFRHYDLGLFLEQLGKSCKTLDVVNVDYIYKSDGLVSRYLSLTQNSRWTVEIKAFNKVLWQYIWNNLRITTKEHGRHMIVHLQKRA